jgi:hypothetical protein
MHPNSPSPVGYPCICQWKHVHHVTYNRIPYKDDKFFFFLSIPLISTDGIFTVFMELQWVRVRRQRAWEQIAQCRPKLSTPVCICEPQFPYGKWICVHVRRHCILCCEANGQPTSSSFVRWAECGPTSFTCTAARRWTINSDNMTDYMSELHCRIRASFDNTIEFCKHAYKCFFTIVDEYSNLF